MKASEKLAETLKKREETLWRRAESITASPETKDDYLARATIDDLIYQQIRMFPPAKQALKVSLEAIIQQKMTAKALQPGEQMVKWYTCQIGELNRMLTLLEELTDGETYIH